MSNISPISNITASLAAPRADLTLRTNADDAAELRRAVASKKADEFRKRFGEFIGGVFFVPMLEEAQKSPFKTKYSNGGHAEEVFQGQLAAEISKKAGRVIAGTFARHLLAAAERNAHLGGVAAPHSQGGSS